jgi:hypothetical protein
MCCLQLALQLQLHLLLAVRVGVQQPDDLGETGPVRVSECLC